MSAHLKGIRAIAGDIAAGRVSSVETRSIALNG